MYSRVRRLRAVCDLYQKDFSLPVRATGWRRPALPVMYMVSAGPRRATWELEGRCANLLSRTGPNFNSVYGPHRLASDPIQHCPSLASGRRWIAREGLRDAQGRHIASEFHTAPQLPTRVLGVLGENSSHGLKVLLGACGAFFHSAPRYRMCFTLNRHGRSVALLHPGYDGFERRALYLNCPARVEACKRIGIAR